ncbi:hypothetical protein AN477_18250 [Alicyclobacillus ferrooxydans]|uniref:Uncharacterized protein n=1 Tax=Alicyclobacillus ferrooxydans TaxID=471514 RepID=A0A0P9CRU0_9BACL|nr:hypothetical protein AN477_18250 [Alicyclobacillus ferrooxydans]
MFTRGFRSLWQRLVSSVNEGGTASNSSLWDELLFLMNIALSNIARTCFAFSVYRIVETQV